MTAKHHTALAPRILVCPWGRGLGHVSPAAAIVRALDGHGALVLQPGEAPYPHRFPIPQIATPPVDCTGVWEAFADADVFEQLVRRDREILDAYEAGRVLVDGRLSMIVAAEEAGIACTTIVRESYAPGHKFAGEDDDFWDRMLGPVNRSLARRSLEPVTTDVRELLARHPAICPSYRWFEELDDTNFRHRVRFTGPLSFPGPLIKRAALPAETTNILVYGVLRTPGDVRALANALHGSKRRAYVAAPNPTVGEAISCDRTGQIEQLGYIDLTASIGAFDGLVVHGGHGACLAAADNKRPTVVLAPEGRIEQYSNARKMARMELATHVETADWHQIVASLPEQADRIEDRGGEGAGLRLQWDRHAQAAAHAAGAATRLVVSR